MELLQFLAQDQVKNFLIKNKMSMKNFYFELSQFYEIVFKNYQVVPVLKRSVVRFPNPS